MPTRYRVVIETCIECAACVETCPLAAISDDPYKIDVNLCNGCGDCAAACPVEAIEAYEWTPPPPPGDLEIPKIGLFISLTLKE